MAIKEGEIIPFQEQRLLVLPGAELNTIQRGEIVKSTEPYLGTDVYMGSYGVASFGLFVPSPQIRPTVYYPSEGPVSNSPNSDETPEDFDQYSDDPLRKFHFRGTEKGFAVIRTILAPMAVSQKLEEDQHLGPALINKSCLEGTVPDELDEMTELEEPESSHSSSSVVLDEAFLTDEMHYKIGVGGEPNPYTNKVLNHLQAATGTKYALLREYPSWHSYRAYRPVMEAMIQGCQATVANFDEVLALLAKD
ncbi:MAG TPA: hypothetical protein VNG32_01915, partial [Candidatus Dormibacteraeota bacterium]|nr:hypothetical protein [Candidatus Dormibacteraeota bacterium]